jgi:hypothetical protein
LIIWQNFDYLGRVVSSSSSEMTTVLLAVRLLGLGGIDEVELDDAMDCNRALE